MELNLCPSLLLIHTALSSPFQMSLSLGSKILLHQPSPGKKDTVNLISLFFENLGVAGMFAEWFT